jgi:hypothetical protein
LEDYEKSPDKLPDNVRIQLRDDFRAAAIQDGEVSTVRVGDLTFKIYGGDEVDRLEQASDLKRILDGPSARGQRLREMIEMQRGTGASAQPLEVVIAPGVGTFTEFGTGMIAFDPRDLTARYDAISGRNSGGITTTRVLAHELGHVAGYHDVGAPPDANLLRVFGIRKDMDNVYLNENPIMRQLGEFNDRLSYHGH